MRLSVLHTSRYEYSEPVSHGLLRVRLTPKSSHGQAIEEWSIDLDGAVAETRYVDQNNNVVVLASVDPQSSCVSITSRGVVVTSDNAGVAGYHVGHMPLWAFLQQTDLTRPGPLIRELADNLRREQPATLEILHELSRRTLSAVSYELGRTHSATVAEDAMLAGHGVCQDHSHIFISVARELDIPARYVSGYLMMDDRSEQEAGHAWVEAHVPQLGWVGFDVSNGISPDERYVRVATGRDYRDAAPITGISYGGGDSELSVHLTVEQHTSGQ